MTQNTNTDPSLKSLAIQVSGPDAAKFLQGQLSCDLNSPTTKLGAYCNIKGRVEALFNLYQDQGVFYLQTDPSILQETISELKKYAVFSKVELGIVETDFMQLSDEQAIRAGIPQIYAATRGMFFPHDLNLPALGAVSFSKGCYRGQEIVARMEYRGNLKRRLEFFESDNLELQPAEELPAGGTVVRVCKFDNDKLIGLAVKQL